jgi:hypothetical protein
MAETTITITIKIDSNGATITHDQTAPPSRAVSPKSRRVSSENHLSGSVDDEPGGEDPSRGF